MHVLLTLEVGGAERLVVNVLRHLDPDRYVRSVCALQGGGPLQEELERLGVRVFLLRKREGVDGPLILKLARLLRRERVDLLHTHNSAPFFYGPLAAALARVPAVVHTQHSKLLPEQEKLRRASRWLGRGVRHFIGDAAEVSASLQADLGLPPHRVSTILNGVAVPRWDARPDPPPIRTRLGLEQAGPILGCVARLAPVKDQATLLRAFRRVQEEWPAASLLLVGDGPERGNLERLAEELGIASHVRFLGERNDVGEVLAACDVFVLASLSEGLSLALLEAMAAGKPVVATAVGGNVEVVREGETGLLVPPAQPERLAAAIRQVLSQPAWAAQLGRAAHDHVAQHFSLTRMVAQYEAIYAACLSQCSRWG